MIDISLSLLFITFLLSYFIILKVDGRKLTTNNIAIYFVLLLYFLFLFLSPTYWHAQKQYLLFGNNLEGYVSTTILYYSLAIISLVFGYCYSKPVFKDKRLFHSVNILYINGNIIRIVFLLNLLLVIYWAYSSTYSIRALFLINLFSSSPVTEDVENSTGPLSLFIDSLIASFSLLFINKRITIAEKCFYLLLTIGIFIGLGFRYRLILMSSILFLSYLCINSFSPKSIRNIVISGLILILALVLFSFVRNEVKQLNRGIVVAESQSESHNRILDKFFHSIRSFYSFTSLVKYIDEGKGEYDYGETMFLNIAYRFIPASLFSGGVKPRPIGVEQSALSWGSMEGYYAGEAYSNIGEYYQTAGLAAIISFMSLLGVFIRFLSCQLTKWQLIGGLSLTGFQYIVIISSLFQMITRGYLPQYVLILIYLLLPIYFCKFLLSIKKVVLKK